MYMTDCRHPEHQMRWRNQSIGLIGRQCLDCLQSVTGSNWLSHPDALRERGTFDGMQEWATEPESLFSKIELAGLDNHGRTERFVDTDEYTKYMTSDAWRRRRSKVMMRANDICEGCLTQAAEHVHHRTYAHFGAEFAFELLALCKPCHDRWHSSPHR